MNRRQELFVAEYLVDRNATQAAIRAGFSKSRAKQTGYRLIHSPAIELAVAKASAELQERLSITAETIAARLWLIHEKAFHGSPKTDREGRAVFVDGVQMYEWSPPTSVRALEALARQLGIGGADRLELVTDGEVRYTLTLDRELPDDEVEGDG